MIRRDSETEEFVTEPVNSNSKPEVELNDTLIRLIGIPFFGIAIPNLTGLFGVLNHKDALYWLGYLYFIGLAFLIWQGNRYLLFRTRKRFTWFDKPMEKLILLFVNNIFFTAPLTIAWLCTWYRWAGLESIKWDTIIVVALVNVICVLFVTHVYETVFMVKEQEDEQLKSAQLLKGKAEAELEALKNQIDPHFMFNALNSLSYLIEKDPAKAKQFTENLAEVYRYILSQKEHVLVLLEDEFTFIHTYVDLIKIRFGEALTLQQDFNGTTGKEFLIPPISAFVAFENAVKHNEISERMPLLICVKIENNTLVIANKLQPKRSIQHSSNIGLKNLSERYLIITGKKIEIENANNFFTVRLPLSALSAS